MQSCIQAYFTVLPSIPGGRANHCERIMKCSIYEQRIVKNRNAPQRVERPIFGIELKTLHFKSKNRHVGRQKKSSESSLQSVTFSIWQFYHSFILFVGLFRPLFTAIFMCLCVCLYVTLFLRFRRPLTPFNTDSRPTPFTSTYMEFARPLSPSLVNSVCCAFHIMFPCVVCLCVCVHVD